MACALERARRKLTAAINAIAAIDPTSPGAESAGTAAVDALPFEPPPPGGAAPFTQLTDAAPPAVQLIVKTTPLPLGTPAMAGKNDWTAVYGGRVGGDISKPSDASGMTLLAFVVDAVTGAAPLTLELKYTLFGGGGNTSVSVPPLIGTVAVPGPQVPGPLGVPAAEIEYCADAAGATTTKLASAAARAHVPHRALNG